jgi:hypothetical protein
LDDTARHELDLLERQLERMRDMLFAYSALFFTTIRNWALVAIGLLVLGWSGVVPPAVALVPFIVPFAFLETGYLFWYTVFARRHAERLEEAINERLGREVLVAHRLERAYFYPPDAPKVAAFSMGNPGGYMSLMTLGYTAGAVILWLAGFFSTTAFTDAVQAAADADPTATGVSIVLSLLPLVAIAWTIAVAGVLAWLFLGRRDENRLVAALRHAYRLPEPPAPMPADDPASAGSSTDQAATSAAEPMEAPTR